jgi:hypothetical protein
MWEVNVQWFLATLGGNQVDGLPPVSNTTVVDISETIGHIMFQAFVRTRLIKKNVYVVRIDYSEFITSTVNRFRFYLYAA